jgi:hypothetical protein
MDAEWARGTKTAAAGIQWSRPVEFGRAFGSIEWACNATSEWRSLRQEEERPSRSIALYPALGRAVRWLRGLLRFLSIRIDPPAADSEAKRRRQAHQLAIERVDEPLQVRAQEKQEQRVAR